MPNPWEEYQVEEEAGPWTEYASVATESAPSPQVHHAIPKPKTGILDVGLPEWIAQKVGLGPAPKGEQAFIMPTPLPTGGMVGVGAPPVDPTASMIPPLEMVTKAPLTAKDIPALPPTAGAWTAEAINQVAGLAKFATSPVGAAGVAGVLPALGVAAGTTAEIAGEMPELAARAGRVSADPGATAEEKAQAYLGLAGPILMPLLPMAARPAVRALRRSTVPRTVRELPGEPVQPVPAEAAPPGAEVLPEVPRQVPAGVEAMPSTVRRAAVQGELPGLRTDVPQARQVAPETLRGVRQPGQPEAPSGLQPTAEGQVVVHAVPQAGTPSPEISGIRPGQIRGTSAEAFKAPAGEGWFGPNGPVEVVDFNVKKGIALVRLLNAPEGVGPAEVKLSQLYRRKLRPSATEPAKATPADAADMKYRELERQAIAEAEGVPVKVTDEALPEGLPFKGKVAVATPDGVVINDSQFRKWIGQIPERRRAKAIRTLMGEELFHHKAVNTIPDAELAGLWRNGLTEFERGLTTKSYWGRNKVEPMSDALYGHEYLRRVNQWAKKKGVREVAETTTIPDWLTEAGIDVALRGIHQARRALAAAPALGRIGGVGAKLKAGTAADVARMLKQAEQNLTAAKANRAHWDKKAEEREAPGAVAKEPEDFTALMARGLEMPDITNYKSTTLKGVGGPTAYFWEVGSKARTAEDVAALRGFAEQSSKRAKELMGQGKFTEAMLLVSRQPAEAYEFATGVKLDGTPKWDMFEKKFPGYKPSVPDPQYLAAKGISPEQMVAARRKKTAKEIGQEMLALPEVPKGAAVERPTAEAAGAIIPEPPSQQSALADAVQFLTSRGTEKPNYKDFERAITQKHGESAKPFAQEAWIDAVWSRVQKMSPEELATLNDRLLNMSEREIQAASEARQRAAKTGEAEEIPPPPAQTPAFKAWQKQIQKLERRGALDFTDPGEKAQFADMAAESARLRRQLRFGNPTPEETIAIRDRLAEWETIRSASAELNRIRRQPEHAAQLEAEQRYKALKAPEAESAAKIASRERQRAAMMADVAQRLIKQTVSPELSLERSNIGPDEIAWEAKRVGDAWKEFDETEPMGGEILGKALTQGSRVSGQPESVTRRVASVRDNLTGEVIMVSTFKTGAGDYMIVNPEKVSKRPNVSVSSLLGEKTAGGKPRYTILASGALTEPVKNYKRRFESEGQWRDQFADEAAAQAEAAAGRQAEAVSAVRLAEKLEEAGIETEERTPRAMVPPEQRVEPKMPTEPVEEPPPATPEQIQQRRLAEEQARVEGETRARYFGSRAGLDAWLRKQAVLNALRPGTPMQPPPAPKVRLPSTTTGARELTMRKRIPPTMIPGQPLPKGAGPPPTLAAVFKPAAKGMTEFVRDIIREPARAYSEWMVERLQRVGGPIIKASAQEFNKIISREKDLYGSLNVPVPASSLDPAAKAATTAAASRLGVLRNWITGQDNGVLDMARLAAGKPGKATTWLHQINPVTRRSGMANVVKAIEGTTQVPQYARDTVLLGRMANILTGRLLEPVIPGFVATGKFQRNITAYGYDVIRSGTGRVWNDWVEGLASANGLAKNTVAGFFRKWKSILDEPGVDANRIEQVNQDFARTFPEVVTHVKAGDIAGGRWEQVVHADLFNYLETAARHATHTRAFRESFPNTPVGQRTFRAMQNASRSELPAENQADWDNLMRAMQGHPTDTYSASGLWGPGKPLGETFRNLNATVGNVMAKAVLTGQMFVQPGENIAGSTPVFLGYKNYLRGLAQLRQLYPQLEMNGAVNRVMYDFSFDPASPIRSSARITGNTISKGFMEQMLNELQEATAAATARVVSERIQSGNLTGWERRQLPLTLKAMGFSKAQVADVMARRAPELLSEFERKAATFLSAGNKAIAEGSSLGSNRLFNSLFRFQSYPMMKMNQLRKVLGNFGDAFGSQGTAKERLASSEQLARFLVGNALQGALTVGITALAYEGLFGASIRKEEATDEPMRFMVESALASMSGPLYLVWRGARDRGLTGVGEQATRLLFPYSILRDMHDASTGSGPYKNLDAQDRLAKFASQKLPGTRALMTGLSAVGLAQPNRKLDTAIKAFGRWRRAEMGFSQEDSNLKDDTREQFRVSMKKAVEALKKGDFDAYRESLAEASGQPGLKKESIPSSLRARKILKTPDGKPLNLDQLDALRQRIGPEAVDRLQWFDMMLDKAAEGVLLGPYE